MTDERTGSRLGWLRSPLLWLAGAVVAGLGLAITNFAQRAVESVPGRLQAPLEIGATTDYGQMQASFLGVPEYLIPLSPDDIDGIPPGWGEGLDARQRWVRDLGGAPANSTWVQIDVRGRGERPVLLTDLRVNVLDRQPPLDGTIVDYGDFGDPITERIVEFSLLYDPPRLVDSRDNRWLHGAISESEAEPVNFPYQVSSTEVELFYVNVTTYPYRAELDDAEGCYCLWNLEMSYSDGENSGSIIIDDDGEPFRTTSTQGNEPIVTSYDGEPVQVSAP